MKRTFFVHYKVGNYDPDTDEIILFDNESSDIDTFIDKIKMGLSYERKDLSIIIYSWSLVETNCFIGR